MASALLLTTLPFIAFGTSADLFLLVRRALGSARPPPPGLDAGSGLSPYQQLVRQVQYASDALEQAEGLYQVGLATNLERLAAQDRLLSAQLQLVNADLDRKVFYLDLLRTAGVLHEMIGLVREQPIEPEPAGGVDAAAR